MKLIVTVPAYNEERTIGEVIAEVPRSIPGVDQVEVLVVDDGSEDRTAEAASLAGADHVIRHGRNTGLASAFRTALKESLARGADIIVNTDADNHYDQSRIPDLVEPILRERAEVAVGSRVLDGVSMRPANRHGNWIANQIMQRLLGLPHIDVSTGFRAYSRNAALKLNVLSQHTYTHETLIHARDLHLAIANVPITARSVRRPSRLIDSLPRHVWRAGLVILNSFAMYRPLQVWSILGLFFTLVATIPFVRFLYFFSQGEGSGHIQSLVVGCAMLFIGVQTLVAGLLASAISCNRRLLEDMLFRMKDWEARSTSRTNAYAGRNGEGRAPANQQGGIHVN